MRPLPRILILMASLLSSRALLAAPVPEGVRITSGNDDVTLDVDGDEQAFIVADIVNLTVTGPRFLDLRFHVLARRRRFRRVIEGTVTLVRDDVEIGTWDFDVDEVEPSIKPVPAGRAVSTMLVRRIQVPAGEHSLKLGFDLPAKTTAALQIGTANVVDESVLLGPYEPPPAPKPKPEPKPAAASPAAPPAPPSAAASATPVGEPPATQPRSAPAAPARKPQIAPIVVTKADGTIAGATAVLANALATSFDQLDRGEPFHRIAVPYFQELGDAVSENNLGKLVPELLAVELAKRKGFVVVERERLDQVMREHRLADLGIVDDDTAAEMGKVLGAESIVSGTVGEAGASFIVTVRMVGVETGRVLVSGKIEIERAGLIALSSEAVVTRSVTGAAIRSVLLPGWGQIYNGESLEGYLMLAAAIAGIGAAGTFTALRVLKGAEYDGAQGVTPAHIAGVRRDGNLWANAANIAWAVYGLLWGAAVIDAVVNGKDFATVEVSNGTAAAGLGFVF